MSKELMEFLREWLAWAEAGAPPDPRFDTGFGLCTNLKIWCGETEKNSESNRLSAELRVALGGANYPFNENSSACYEAEEFRYHRNEKRISWVKEKLNEQ